MEVVSYISIGAIGALIVSRLVDVFQTWLSSPVVQQLVNTTIQIRESLPPIVVEIGIQALVVLKNIVYAIVQILASLPPIVLEGLKALVIHLAQAFHLVVHIGAQAVILFKNIYHVVIYAGKSIFVVLRSFNRGFELFWNFTDTVLTPLVNWMMGYPVQNTTWRSLILSSCFVILMSWILKIYLKKKKLKNN